MTNPSEGLEGHFQIGKSRDLKSLNDDSLVLSTGIHLETTVRLIDRCLDFVLTGENVLEQFLFCS